MKLRCGKCKKYKEEKFFSIHAREENRKNWIGKGSEQSNTTTIVVRGGYSYTCMDCNNTAARERYEREIKFPEKAEKKRLFRKRSRHKKKYIKEGYTEQEAVQIAEKEVPYLWNEEGYEWSDEKLNWVRVSE